MTQRLQTLAAALAVAGASALMAGCGGGSGDAPAPTPAPQATSDVPQDAIASTDAFVAWAEAQPASDTAEPLKVQGTLPPTSDTEEPKKIR